MQNSLNHQQAEFSTLLGRFQRAFRALLTLLEDYPEDRRDMSGAAGEWSPRQLVTVLSIRFEHYTTQLQDYLAGKPGTMFDGKPPAAEIPADRSGEDWERTLEDLRRAYDRFETQMQDVPLPKANADPHYGELLTTLRAACMDYVGQLLQFLEKR